MKKSFDRRAAMIDRVLAGEKRTLRSRGHSRGRSAASSYVHAGVDPIEHRGELPKGLWLNVFSTDIFPARKLDSTSGRPVSWSEDFNKKV